MCAPLALCKGLWLVAGTITYARAAKALCVFLGQSSA